MSREQRLSLPQADVVAAAALFVAAELELVLAGGAAGPSWAAVPLLVALTVPLAWRRQAPMAMVGVLAAATVAASPDPLQVLNLTTPIVVLVIAAYSVAAYEPRPRAAVGLATSLAGDELAVVIGHAGAGAGTFIGVACTAAWAVGRVVRARQAQVARLEAHIDLLCDEGEDRSKLAVISERTRLARRVREVVANNVDPMLGHSAAARTLLGRDLSAAERELAAIEVRGQDALADLRSLLGLLRSPDPTNLGPLTGLGQVQELVDGARSAGRVLELRVDGQPRAIPASTDVAVFWILQDAVDTGPQRMGITIDLSDLEVRIDITAQPAVPAIWPTAAMRERAASCGGRFSIPAPERQVLTITLPVVDESIRR